MSGLYLHIPFCKQACYYCDFHFSTNQSYRERMIHCMANELLLQKDYLSNEPLETIYFGGGTPSVLNVKDLELIFNTIHSHFLIIDKPEITLEANPDDLNKHKIKILKEFGINRLSLGIQSFDNKVLNFLHRAHTAEDALNCISLLRDFGFDNISIDLIHSIPNQPEDILIKNIQQALLLEPEHISAYSLTIEENTVFGKWAAKGKVKATDENDGAHQFELVMNMLTENGFQHYEISNFCQPGFQSKHNSSYWQQKKYLGIGPSAHSYNGESRQFNISNNHLYMKSLENGIVPFETETLSRADKINEYLFTSLRTEAGCDLSYLKENYQFDLVSANVEYLESLQQGEKLLINNEKITLTRQGKLVADKIASDLFVLVE